MLSALLLYQPDKDELLLQIFYLQTFLWKQWEDVPGVSLARESVSLALCRLCALMSHE